MRKIFEPVLAQSQPVPFFLTLHYTNPFCSFLTLSCSFLTLSCPILPFLTYPAFPVLSCPFISIQFIPVLPCPFYYLYPAYSCPILALLTYLAISCPILHCLFSICVLFFTLIFSYLPFPVLSCLHTNPVLSCHISCPFIPILLFPVLSCPYIPILLFPVPSYPVLPYQSCSFLSYLALSVSLPCPILYYIFFYLPFPVLS